MGRCEKAGSPSPRLPITASPHHRLPLSPCPPYLHVSSTGSAVLTEYLEGFIQWQGRDGAAAASHRLRSEE